MYYTKAKYLFRLHTHKRAGKIPRFFARCVSTTARWRKNNNNFFVLGRSAARKCIPILGMCVRREWDQIRRHGYALECLILLFTSSAYVTMCAVLDFAASLQHLFAFALLGFDKMPGGQQFGVRRCIQNSSKFKHLLQRLCSNRALSLCAGQIAWTSELRPNGCGARIAAERVNKHKYPL